MGKLTKRTWYVTGPTGRRIKRVAHGFTAQTRDGTQVRRMRAEWTKDDAEKALAEFQLGIEQEKTTQTGGVTFGEAVQECLKAAGGLRQVEEQGAEDHRNHRPGDRPAPGGGARPDLGPGRPESGGHSPRDHQIRQAAGSPDAPGRLRHAGRVIGSARGPGVQARSIRNAFDYATEAAGLGDFHFHDARHHFASWFMMRGGSLQELKEILGHADITMTLRYAHLSPAHLRSAMLKTERTSAQDSAQEVVAVLEASRK